jgi:hypothetical protein
VGAGQQFADNGAYDGSLLKISYSCSKGDCSAVPGLRDRGRGVHRREGQAIWVAERIANLR